MRHHSAGHVPESRRIHLDGGRSATSLARIADAIAALDLEDAVVIGIEIMAVLAAVIDIGESRKRMADGAGGEREGAAQRQGAKRHAPAALARMRFHVGLLVRSSLLHTT